jgi:hypothetical protein
MPQSDAGTSPDHFADLADVLALLEKARVPCLVFGRWAEELLALRPRGPHRDIDLVHLSDSFASVAIGLETGRLPQEIRAKRFPHKRAFIWRGLCCEIILIRDWRRCPVTWFWGDVPLFWQTPLARARPMIGAGHCFRLVSAANLRLHRARHRDTQPWRWRTSPSDR